MPKLGLISDTHGRLRASALDALAQVDCILHAGDIGSLAVLLELESLGVPVLAVLGNNDWADYGPDVRAELSTTFGGARIWMSHYPGDAERAAASGAYDLAVHGHTHVPRDEVRNGCRIVNPGSASRPRGGSKACVGIVEVEDGAAGPLETVLL